MQCFIYEYKKFLDRFGTSFQEALESEKKLITFIKLHAPWDVCCVYAEDLGVRAPLQVRVKLMGLEGQTNRQIDRRRAHVESERLREI